MANRLTSEDVIRIQQDLDEGLKPNDIATKHGVSRVTVYRISDGKRKAHSGQAGRVTGKLKRCVKHGLVKVPCVGCEAERYRREHPEIEWVDPVPDPAPPGMRGAIAAQMRLIDEFSESMIAGN
jgi:hypothetical protein